MTGTWIESPDGVKALVEGAYAVAVWTRVHGWTVSSEPTGQEFQWVRHTEHGGKGVLNHEAALLHEELGWVPSGPAGYDEPADEPVTEPAPSPTPKSAAAATSGDEKE